MSVPPLLHVYRHDFGNRAPVAPHGEIDPSSAPVVHTSPERYRHDGIRAGDVDVTAVAFRGCGGLNTFPHPLPHTAAAQGILQLHHPSPALERLDALTGSGSLFLTLPDAFAGSRPSPPPSPAREAAHRLAPAPDALPGGVL